MVFVVPQVNRLLSESDVWAAFSGQKHDLFLPAGGPPNAGVAGLLQVRAVCHTSAKCPLRTLPWGARRLTGCMAC